jgi:hypothetical protein
MRTATDPLEGLRWTLARPDGTPVQADERLRSQVRAYAQQWLKQNQSLPQRDHPVRVAGQKLVEDWFDGEYVISFSSSRGSGNPA